jgi:hypothetical protein
MGTPGTSGLRSQFRPSENRNQEGWSRFTPTIRQSLEAKNETCAFGRRIVLCAFGVLFAILSLQAQLTVENKGLEPEAVRKCAEQGDAECQDRLGLFYEWGLHGVKEDHSQAIQWYRRAAEQGLLVAQVVLAHRYENGDDVPQDYEEAARWYRMAADRGDLDSQREIGFLYAMGRGVPQDYIRAYMWANLRVVALQSKEQNDLNAVRAGPGTEKEKEEVVQTIRKYEDSRIASAIDTRNSFEARMTPTQVSAAQRLAREWKPPKAK